MNEKSFSESYKAAGVDITAGYRAVELMKEHIRRTMSERVIDGIGGFGGLYELDLTGIERPVLVSGTDGVGTKLKLAFEADRHDTIGIDCVAMCANDVLCVGAKPQLFLDYIACGKNVPERIAAIVKGVAEGCVQSGAALVGGETAEMPGFYPEDEYDLAGFCVGLVDKNKILNRENVKPGDVILGLASSGVHSNGFSLVRRVFGIGEKDLKEYDEKLGASLLDTLLTPTRIYVKPVLKLLEEVHVRSISHITGGGFFENIPRCLPKGVSASIQKSSYSVPKIFRLIQETGDISERDMYNTFNMGIGHVHRGSAGRGEQGADAAGKRGRAGLEDRRSHLRRRRCRAVVRVAVLVSGGGTNLQALMDAQRRRRARPCAHRLCALQPQGRLCAGACQGPRRHRDGRAFQGDAARSRKIRRSAAAKAEGAAHRPDRAGGISGHCGRKGAGSATPDAF